MTLATAADFAADLPFLVAPEPADPVLRGLAVFDPAPLSPRPPFRLDLAPPSDPAAPDLAEFPFPVTGAAG
ncbi:MAG TPA: hypothetical protein VMR14_25400 [Streptosporangiaceae bacterium]|nr:hypothetical protein [Streptosporangiaceae bacterium]